MKEPKRARRIRDLERMKAKSKRVRPWDVRAKNAEHLQCCSCFMCGNRRIWEGPRVSELRWLAETP